MHKDVRKIKGRIKSAFNRLKKQQVIAESNFLCCTNCAQAAIYEDIMNDSHKGYCFYHTQSNDNLNQDGQVYIQYGRNASVTKSVVAIGKLIKKELEASNLEVKWNGKADTAILVKGLADQV
jgi:hypothetical protein